MDQRSGLPDERWMDDYDRHYCVYSGVSGIDMVEHWEIVATISNSTQTLEEGCHSQDIENPAREK